MSGEEPRPASDMPLPGGSFRLLVQRLAYQCLMSLGVLENPITHTRQVNLPGARALLDDLAMLRDKTSGNLDHEEAEHLAKVLADLEHTLARRGGSGESA